MFKPLYESLDAVSKESIQLFREYLIKMSSWLILRSLCQVDKIRGK